jgi:hypothetical protein
VIDRKVLCYVPEDPAAGWLFTDCHAEQARRYNVGRGGYTADRDAEPLIRSVRLSGQDFESGLILTLYGKTLRWGPGWWLDHPGPEPALEPAHRPQPGLQPHVVRLDGVVRVPLNGMQSGGHQLIEHARRSRDAVGGDLGQDLADAQRAGEEEPSGG